MRYCISCAVQIFQLIQVFQLITFTTYGTNRSRSNQPKKKVSANKHHNWTPFTINSAVVTEIDEQYQKWQPYTSKTVIFHAGNRNKEKLRILLSLEKMNQPVWSRCRGGVEQVLRPQVVATGPRSSRDATRRTIGAGPSSLVAALVTSSTWDGRMGPRVGRQRRRRTAETCGRRRHGQSALDGRVARPAPALLVGECWVEAAKFDAGNRERSWR
jgi:hypothetical protein